MQTQMTSVEFPILTQQFPFTPHLYAKKSVAGGEIRRVIYRFFLVIDTNQWLCGQGEL